jgi:hypothetical protein
MIDQLKNLTQIERVHFLRNNATAVREGHYFHKYSQEELEVKKTLLVEQCIDLDAKEAELSEIKKRMGKVISTQKEERTTTINQIKMEGENAQGELYDFADYESGYMITYSITGDEVSKRKLRPEEKQPALTFQQLKSN